MLAFDRHSCGKKTGYWVFIQPLERKHMYTWADIKGNMGAWIWRTRALTLHLWLEVGFLTEKQEIKFLCSTPNKGHCCDLSHPWG